MMTDSIEIELYIPVIVIVFLFLVLFTMSFMYYSNQRVGSETVVAGSLYIGRF